MAGGSGVTSGAMKLRLRMIAGSGVVIWSVEIITLRGMSGESFGVSIAM